MTISIAEQALNRAVNFLRAGGFQYRIQRDGHLLLDTLPAPAPDKPKRRLVNNFSRDTGYVQTLDGLQPGTGHTWSRADLGLTESHAWASFCSSVASTARKRFGTESVLTARTEEAFEILRVE